MRDHAHKNTLKKKDTRINFGLILISAVQALTQKYFFLWYTKHLIKVNMPLQNWKRAVYLYFQETTLRTKDDEERKKFSGVSLTAYGFIIRATDKHNQCSSIHLNAAFLSKYSNTQFR